jgi:MoaA/NifB/PqqE/SkfB family radical SAM enzyme
VADLKVATPAASLSCNGGGKSLLNTYLLREALLEFTTACNLRCVYCSVSSPDHQPQAMAPQHMDQAVEGLSRLLLGTLVLNGHGETTVRKDWQAAAARFDVSSVHVKLTTNLSRPLSQDEVNRMARLHTIVVSIDSEAPDILALTRKGANLEVIRANLAAVRRTAQEQRQRLCLVLACVVHDKNVMRLDSLVRFGLHEGFDGFVLCNLIEPARREAPHPVSHPASLPPAEIERALNCIESARGIARAHGVAFVVQQGLMDSLRTRVAGGAESYSAKAGKTVRHCERPPAGRTRHCLDPWRTVFIRATGEVRPCCYQASIGTLGQSTLDEILKSQAARDLRRRLLSGDLDECCLSCPDKGVSSLFSQRAAVFVFAPWTVLHAMAFRVAFSLRAKYRRLVPARGAWWGKGQT